MLGWVLGAVFVPAVLAVFALRRAGQISQVEERIGGWRPIETDECIYCGEPAMPGDDVCLDCEEEYTCPECGEDYDDCECANA